MPLTGVNCLIILLGLVITWWALFSIFNEKSSFKLGRKLGLLVMFLSPIIAKFSYDVYAITSRVLFMMHANGEIQLAVSPLKVSDTKDIDYCSQFKDKKGKPLKDIFADKDDKIYCGTFWSDKQNVIFLPYKILDNNKAIYWASPELSIVGPKPNLFRDQVEELT